MAGPLFEVAAAYDAREDPAARLHLIVQLCETEDPGDPAEDIHHEPEPPRVDVLSVSGDVPATREDELCVRRRVIQNGLSRAGRVPLNPPRGQYREYPVTPCDRFLDDPSVVRSPGDHDNAPPETIEFAHALFPAYADDVVAAIEGMLNHVLAELPRGSHDTNSHPSSSSRLSSSGRRTKVHRVTTHRSFFIARVYLKPMSHNVLR